MDLVAGLFGGFGAIVLWESLLKPRVVRRQVARLLLAEILLYVRFLEEIQEHRKRNPQTRPIT